MNTWDMPAQPDDIYTVSRLNHDARQLLERGLGRVWLMGEVSNFTRASSGHWYFSLKDERAQVRCAMFAQANRRAAISLKNGITVLARAQVSVYEPRGDYQLILEQVELAGEGLLRQRFEQLKQALMLEGLFDEDRKQPLPLWPRCIGVVTSPTGAAIRDILNILKRRAPAIPIIVYPVPVQGEQAAPAIAQMIQTADQRQEVDVLIIARGGGSLEDLWAFNEEIVARAVSACTIPTISGVGHEIDVTICDGVADVRAPTPSGAAELCAPDQTQVLRQIEQLQSRLQHQIHQHLKQATIQLSHWVARLTREHPRERLLMHHQTLDELSNHLNRHMLYRLESERQRLTYLTQRLAAHTPTRHLNERQAQLQQLTERLKASVTQQLRTQQQKLSSLTRTLNAVSPLSTLDRGYSIVQSETGQVISSVQDITAQQSLNIRWKDGQALVSVIRTKN
jgi:exodeoxyribonuclease VII large subunit